MATIESDTEAEYDKCVLCGSITQYKKDTPISERKNYVECAGQLCNECSSKFNYGNEIKKLRKMGLEFKGIKIQENDK